MLAMLALCEQKLNDYLAMAWAQRPEGSYDGQIFFCDCSLGIPAPEPDGESESVREPPNREAAECIQDWCRQRLCVTYVPFEWPVIDYPRKQGISFALAAGAWKYHVLILLDVEASKRAIESMPLRLLLQYLQDFFETEGLSLVLPSDGTFAIFRGGKASPVLGCPDFWTCRRAAPPRGILSWALKGLGLRGPRPLIFDPGPPQAGLRFHAKLRKMWEWWARSDREIPCRARAYFLDATKTTPIEIRWITPDQFTFSDMVWAMYPEARATHEGTRVVEPYFFGGEEPAALYRNE
jgi:hypothetical protein